MNKKGAELISIFLCTLLIFCSFSFPVYAESYDFGYNDSYVNSNSTENKDLIFFPLPPSSNYKNYMIFYFEGNVYMALSDSDFLLFGKDFIQRPSYTDLVLYIYASTSNSWDICDKSQFYNSFWGMVQFPGMTVIDVTCLLESWGAGTPIDQKSIINRTGYRIYWTIALLFINVLNLVEYYADYIMQHELVKYLCVTAFAGEVFIFLILLFRRIGEMRSEEVNL